MILASDQWLKLSRFNLQRAGRRSKHILAVAKELFQQKLSILVVERDLSDVIDDCCQLSIPDLRGILPDLDPGITWILRPDRKSPVLRIQHCRFRCSDTKRVFAPWRDPDTLRIVPVQETAVFFFKIPDQKTAV